MLSKDDLCKAIPFVYFADHDVQGLHIYLVLKYGSASGAFANEIQVCPQLKWAGPPKEELANSPAAYADTWKAQYASSHPSKTGSEIAEACDKWKATMERKLRKKLVVFSERDIGLVKGFKRYDLSKNEPGIEATLLTMSRSKSKFRLADLAQVDVAYVSMFFRTKIAELQATPVSWQPALPPPSALQHKSGIVSSQIDQSQTEVTKEQQQALLEEELA